MERKATEGVELSDIGKWEAEEEPGRAWPWESSTQKTWGIIAYDSMSFLIRGIQSGTVWALQFERWQFHLSSTVWKYKAPVELYSLKVGGLSWALQFESTSTELSPTVWILRWARAPTLNNVLGATPLPFPTNIFGTTIKKSKLFQIAWKLDNIIFGFVDSPLPKKFGWMNRIKVVANYLKCQENWMTMTFEFFDQKFGRIYLFKSSSKLPETAR